ncbi:MAG: hypothetical protein ACKVVT_09890 [Dehalococcoidia bacterium]
MAARPAHIMQNARERVLEALELGHSRVGACAQAGIRDQTLRNWMWNDASFREAVEASERTALAQVESVFLAGAMRDPRLALAYLERREATWRRSTVVDMAPETAAVLLQGLTDAQFGELCGLILRETGNEQPLTSPGAKALLSE